MHVLKPTVSQPCLFLNVTQVVRLHLGYPFTLAEAGQLAVCRVAGQAGQVSQERAQQRRLGLAVTVSPTPRVCATRRLPLLGFRTWSQPKFFPDYIKKYKDSLEIRYKEVSSTALSRSMLVVSGMCPSRRDLEFHVDGR